MAGGLFDHVHDHPANVVVRAAIRVLHHVVQRGGLESLSRAFASLLVQGEDVLSRFIGFDPKVRVRILRVERIVERFVGNALLEPAALDEGKVLHDAQQ
jgi:hypothetical protein